MNSYKYWISLGQAKGIGPANLKKIYSSLKDLELSIDDLFCLTSDELKREFSFNENIISAFKSAKESVPKIEEDYHALLNSGINVILFFENTYPERLHETLKNTIPPILYTYGNQNILKEKGVAILGEKDLSDRGENIAILAAKELAQHKITCISGMVQGASIAHRSALLNGGNTIAIVPYGILHLKIPEILEDIINLNNLIFISPFYPKAEYNKFNAFIRNRLICALSYAVYIVESLLEGGIFEAAKSAKKLGIPLFVTEYKEYPKSASANSLLLSEGAHPVKGRHINNELVPNLDELIGIVKFK